MTFSVVWLEIMLHRKPFWFSGSYFKIIPFKPFKVYSSVTLSTFTMLYSHQHYLISEHFHHPQKKFWIHYVVTPHPLLPSSCFPWQQLICFLSYLFWTLQINGLTQNVAFMSDFLHWAQCFWSSSMLYHTRSFLRTHNIPLYRYATFI